MKRSLARDTTEDPAVKMAEYLRDYPDVGRGVLARKFGVGESYARGVLRKVRGGMVVEKARVKVRGIAEFRREHDIPQKVRDQVKKLGGGYVTEEELRVLCGVPVQSWRRNAELPEFAGNKLKLEGVVYWAGEETVVEMKQITGRV